MLDEAKQSSQYFPEGVVLMMVAGNLWTTQLIHTGICMDRTCSVQEIVAALIVHMSQTAIDDACSITAGFSCACVTFASPQVHAACTNISLFCVETQITSSNKSATSHSSPAKHCSQQYLAYAPGVFPFSEKVEFRSKSRTFDF